MQKRNYLSKCFKLAEKIMMDLTKITEDIVFETSYFDDVPNESFEYEKNQNYSFSKVDEFKIILAYIESFVETERIFLNNPKALHCVIKTYTSGKVEYHIFEQEIEKPKIFIARLEAPMLPVHSFKLERKDLKFLKSVFTYNSFEEGNYINTL